MMAFTTLLVTVSMVAIANADWPGWPYNDNPFPGFAAPVMPSLRFGKSSIPGMPNFAQNFPFFQLHGFPTMPTMPTITFPPLPSASDIINAKPGKGGTFTGVMISSKTQAKRKEDGTIVNETGSTIVTNDNGVVTVKKMLHQQRRMRIQNEPFVFAFPKIPPHNPHHFVHSGLHRPISFIDPKKIESYAPSPSENGKRHFKVSSVRSSAFSINDNGKVKQGGSFDMVENDNGRVKKQQYSFGHPPS